MFLLFKVTGNRSDVFTVKNQTQPTCCNLICYCYPYSLVSGSCAQSSVIEMDSTAKLSYQRLRNEVGFEEDEDNEIRERVIGKAKSWLKHRKVQVGRRRLKIRIPRLRRFLKRKGRLVVVTWAKIVRRLRESHAHFGDLFAGNYLFMQVTPTPLKGQHHLSRGFPSNRYSLAVPVNFPSSRVSY